MSEWQICIKIAHEYKWRLHWTILIRLSWYSVQFRVLLLMVFATSNNSTSAHNVEIMAFVNQEIYTWLGSWAIKRKIKRKKWIIDNWILMWFMAQKFETGQDKKIYTSSAYLLCFANIGLKGMSLFLSRAKPRASQPQLFSFWVAWILDIPLCHIFLSAMSESTNRLCRPMTSPCKNRVVILIGLLLRGVFDSRECLKFRLQCLV